MDELGAIPTPPAYKVDFRNDTNSCRRQAVARNCLDFDQTQ